MSDDLVKSVNREAVLKFFEEHDEQWMVQREARAVVADLRHNGKLDGLDVTAAQILGQIRVNNPTDGGVEQMNAMVTYAYVVGMELDVFKDKPLMVVDQSAPGVFDETGSKDTASADEASAAESEPPEDVMRAPTHHIVQVEERRMGVVPQLLLGILITAALYWVFG